MQCKRKVSMDRVAISKTVKSDHTFTQAIEAINSFEKISQLGIFDFTSAEDLPDEFGVYFVLEKSSDELLYIGSAGKYNTAGLASKQGLKKRIHAGHAPRRFSLINNFFGLFPKHNVRDMEIKKLINDPNSFGKVWSLEEIKIHLYFWKNEEKIPPTLIERYFLSSYINSFEKLPIGNSV